MVWGLFQIGAKPIAVGLFPPPWDYLAHFVTFGLLSALLAISFGPTRLWWAIPCTALVGALDELHQRNLPGRTASWEDFAMDVIGSLIGVWVLSRLLARTKLFDRTSI